MLSAELRATLAMLASEPDRVADVSATDLPALIGGCEALRAALWARLTTPAAPSPAMAPNGSGAPDRLLTAVEAAQRLGVAKRWIYRHADSLPFTRRLTGGTLRFSARGLERWKESRR